ncbi:TKL:IRAK protein kinase [Trichuris trichiura]|uniref:non-specific serine/threonine protein kinase n=1 Tax=Trichuris trichiura TaxID=36087 RepID=A0A077Z4E4_TRITR|nr:TKL:IRAK protein kinase [Trichuris trichiura]
MLKTANTLSITAPILDCGRTQAKHFWLYKVQSVNSSGIQPAKLVSDLLKDDISLPEAIRAKYEEIVDATDNFSPSNVLGQGGYGIVYKGRWKDTVVAVKRISHSKDGISQLIKELQILSLYRHDNILCLYGYCLEERAPCLIYQFMANGSLDDRLHNKALKPLSWTERQRIVTGICRGLNFLHTCSDQPLIHGDVKSANILLDHHLEPKIGDFGLCRTGGLLHAGDNSYFIASHINGTFAYLPPEFITKKRVSSKLDVYSFGTVLIDEYFATGQSPYSTSRTPENLVQYMRHQRFHFGTVNHLIDACAFDKVTTGVDIYERFIDIAFDCTNIQPELRPSLSETLRKLEFET